MLTRLASRAEAVAATAHDPLLTHVAPRWVPDLPSYRCGDAVALTVPLWGRPECMAVGPVDDLASLLHRVAPMLAEHGWHLSLRRSDAALLGESPAWRPLDEWAFRWTDTVPPRPAADDAARWLPPSADEEVDELLARGFADASKRPGDPDVRRWAGIRLPDGRLVACAGDATAHPSIGFVASITSEPDLRGQGHGATVSAWVTQELLREHGRVGLWHMAQNLRAATIYTALGYRDDHQMVALSAEPALR